MFNPGIIFELQNKWNHFTQNHPKFPKFLQAVAGTQMNPGTIIEVKVTSAEGQAISSNIKLTEEDVQMLKALGEMMRNMR